jgi:hypothetical protein
LLFDIKSIYIMPRAWFAYVGSGSVILPDNYLLSLDIPACRNGFTICAIYANFIGDEFPVTLSTNMRRYIANGLTNGVPEPRLPIAAKKYVYMRPST